MYLRCQGKMSSFRNENNSKETDPFLGDVPQALSHISTGASNSRFSSQTQTETEFRFTFGEPTGKENYSDSSIDFDSDDDLSSFTDSDLSLYDSKSEDDSENEIQEGNSTISFLTNLFKPASNLLKDPLTRHIQTCLLFLVSKVCLKFLDVGTDLLTGIQHYRNGDTFWGTLTVFVMFLPFTCSFLVNFTSYFWPKIRSSPEAYLKDPKFSFGWQHLPFIQAFRNAQILFGLSTLNTANPYNFLLISNLKSEASSISALESFLESAPQLLLQLYIILTTGLTSYSQLFSITVSFVSLCHTSLTLFFSARVLEEKEGSPNWRLTVGVVPFVFMDLLGSVVLASLLAVFTKGLGLAIGIAWIVGLNSLLQMLNQYSRQFEKDLEEEQNKRAFQKQSLLKDIPRSLHLSSLTSWIVNTIVVKSTVKLQLASSAISIGIYTFLNTIAILHQCFMERTSTDDYSVIICRQQNLTSDIKLEKMQAIFLNKSSAFVLNTQTIRICHEGESPHDVLLHVILPILCLVVVLKAFADWILFQLSSYSKLVTFVRFFGLNTYHYLGIVEEPEEYKGCRKALLEWLLENIDRANCQHPVTGETIMHVADQIFRAKDVRDLQMKGAKLDIKDIYGKTATKCWEASFTRKVNEASINGSTKDNLEAAQDLSEESSRSTNFHFDFLMQHLKNDDPWWFSLCVLMGSQLSAISSSGESVSQMVATKILRSLGNDISSSLRFLMYLSYDDIYDIMTTIMKQMEKNVDEGIQLLYVILQEHEKWSRQNVWLAKVKSWRARPFAGLLFQQKPSTAKKDLIMELLEIYFIRSKKFETPLHHACGKGKMHLVKLFLESNINPNVQDVDQKTSLHFVCLLGRADIAKLLLEYKAYPNVKDEEHNTPLHLACVEGYADCAKVFLEANGDPNVTNLYEETALHMSCYNGHIDCVKLLLECKAAINVKNVEEQTALQFACKKGHQDCAKLLLEAGADVNIPDENGMTLLHFACKRGLTDSAKLILASISDLNAQDKHGNTALHYACEYEQTGCVEVLLEAKADANICSDDGKTALHLACKRGLGDSVNLLLREASDINVRDGKGKTPLHHACESGHEECADVNYQDKNGTTPLHFACKQGLTDSVRLLLTLNANINAQDHKGKTALLIACKKGHQDCILVLLENHADANIQDKHGTAPLHLACKKGLTDSVKLLLDSNAVKNVQDRKGKNPMYFAKKKKHSSCMKLVRL